jgi:hypothetical protein
MHVGLNIVGLSDLPEKKSYYLSFLEFKILKSAILCFNYNFW